MELQSDQTLTPHFHYSRDMIENGENCKQYMELTEIQTFNSWFILLGVGISSFLIHNKIFCCCFSVTQMLC